ncbi:MAG: 1-(5-phosphoribosyl)-5-[(5-phosphoribosylamino)methylideneamino]imidazole-4-carboxamide isomerase [Halobacteriales archaeon]
MSRQVDVIPAVDVEDGECVQLVQGERDTGSTYGDPVEAAERWIEEGADTLHVVDLDGAFDGERENVDAIEAIAGLDVELQVGGGVRSVEDARVLFELGVERVILGTAAVENPDVVSEVSEHGNVMASIDSRGGEVVVEGWQEGSGVTPVELAREFERQGAESLLYTNVDTEGLLEGVNDDPVRRVVTEVDVPVVASGGVTTTEDVRALRSAGASGVVIGTAFYEGRLTYDEARRALD